MNVGMLTIYTPLVQIKINILSTGLDNVIVDERWKK